MKQLPEKKNRGFTLVEMTVVLAIFAILLAVLVPSLDPVAGFRANRAASSIGAALDRTKTEAMDRLVGEMKLSWTSDGYYISYYLDLVKTGVKEEQPEKIASGRMKISYTDSNGTTVNLWEDGTNQLILTYDRSTGGFLPIQSRVWEQKDILKMLSDGEDIPLDRPENSTQPYCEKITVHGGGQRTRTITLCQDTGKYTISAGKDVS